MAVEVKTCGDHPSSMSERIKNRQANSGAGAKPNVTVQTGNSDRRTFHNIHNSGHFVQPGTAARETGPQEQRGHPGATTQTTGASAKAR